MDLISNYNLEKILKDEVLLEKLSKIQSLDEIKSQLESYGANVTREEIKYILKLKKKITSLKLDDSELDEIAGGLSLPKKLSAGALSLVLGLSGLGMSSKSFAAGGDALSSFERLVGENGAINKNISDLIEEFSANLSNFGKEGKKAKEEFDKKFKNLNKSSNEAKKLMIMTLENLLQRHGMEYNKISKEIMMDLESLANGSDAKSYLSGPKSESLTTFLAIRNDRKDIVAKCMKREELVNVMNTEIQMIAVLRGEQVAKNVFESLSKAGKALIGVFATTFILKNSGDTIDNVKNLIASGENKIKNAIFSLKHKGIDILTYKATLQKIEDRLRKELVGQDEAIDKIIKLMTGYFESLVQAKATGKRHEGGLLLYLTGLPATGKSTAMKIIEQEMNLGSCTVRMSDIIEDKGNNAKSAASRLLKPVISDNGKVKVNVDTDFTRTIKAGRPTLYCIDEVDKMRVWDATSQGINLRNEANRIMGGSIDEMLRNFGDTGQINGIDASGSILVASSNESQEDLKQLESSLYNRYRYCNIQFKDLTADDYKEIILRKSKELKEYYKDKFNLNFEWDDSALDHYSEAYEREKSGGRGVDALINEARAALKNFTDKSENLPEVCHLSFDVSKNALKVTN